jgi:transcriptional regulator with XRE-family HTH domain
MEMLRMSAAAGVPTGQGGPTVRRMILGTQLRRLRERAGITRGQAGYRIRGSESKISRLELGRVGFKERDVVDLLELYGITNKQEHEQFLTLAREGNLPGWWHPYTDLMPKWFEDFVGLEEAAWRIQAYELQVMPGLMQIEEYARAVIQERPNTRPDEIERLVALRMNRQKILAGPDSPRLWAVLDESVLYRQMGGRAVLRAQIDRILEMTAQANITVQIVPFSRSTSIAECSYTVLRFAAPEVPNIAYVQHLAGAQYLEKPDEIEIYSRSLDRLAVAAQTPAESRRTLLNIRDGL